MTLELKKLCLVLAERLNPVETVPSRCPGLDPDLLQRASSDRRSQEPSRPGVDAGRKELKERLLASLSWRSTVLCVSAHV